MGKALYLIVSGMLATSLAICIWVFSGPGNQEWNNEGLVDVPRLNFRPLPDDKKSTLIQLKLSNKTNHLKWTENLMSFLDKYYDPRKIGKGIENMYACSYNTHLPPKGKFCDVLVDTMELGPCIRDNYFGYHKGSPCVFLKLNMINGWVPEYYNEPNDLPEVMPEQLKYHIRYNVTPIERKTIWISCEGENPADVEFMGPVQFYPSTQGLPYYYFPYDKTEGYMSPLVAVQFKRPTTGVVINIECKAWAKNIKHNREDESGMVHFQLLVD
ncbi:sodium/potassium-transporting ATPase subunit beta-2-like [Coccinella septempunctata]|uniref:sodium/potassium-transporting ATPase subunit beta-2-like n=1 Tax=Coccinella septempunctata TaxID=41139 RepID=UPI001D06F8E0|nr:sodium/potassium-transporting ATPase subunit beta-2-like [Coccinella septempunctata]